MYLLVRTTIILYCLLFTTLSSYAKEAPYTDIKTCKELSQKMDDQAFASLFESPVTIKLQYYRRFAGSYGTTWSGLGGTINGCTIEVDASPTDKKNYQQVGFIIVFHQEDASNLYQQAKQEFANNDYILYRQQTLPYIVEGFIDKTLPNDSTFNTYLNNQYYLILILDRHVEGTPKSAINRVTPIFTQFINIATQQIANSQ